jgi:hypothetical protein
VGVVEAPAPIGRSERLYAGLLRAYPRAFRERYADEMVQLFVDQLREARAMTGPSGVTGTWFRTLLDLASSALGEHLRRDRTMAESLATFSPTRAMRLLGLVGLIGGLLYLWAFVSFNPFEVRLNNAIRLSSWWLGGAAVAIAFHPRLAAARRRLAFAATAAVVFTALWNVLWIVLSWQVESPFGGTFGFVGFLASHAGFLSAAVLGLVVASSPAASSGMGRWAAAITRMAGLSLLVGSILTNVGDDRLGLTDSIPYGEVWTTIALFGQFLQSSGWVLLGSVLVFAGRRARTAA